MTSDVTVIIGWYGDPYVWVPRALYAEKSALDQTLEPDQVLVVSGRDMHTARNTGADLAKTEWLIFLDADDTLDGHYIEQMLQGTGPPTTIHGADAGRRARWGAGPDPTGSKSHCWKSSRDWFDGPAGSIQGRWRVSRPADLRGLGFVDSLLAGRCSHLRLPWRRLRNQR